MPIYFYKCHSCKKDFETRHGMFFEDQRCIFCNSDDVQRIPREVLLKPKKIPAQPTRPGKVVDEYIRDTKREIKKEKEKLKRKEL